MVSKVIAVVVTYNRKELLCECLSAILEQTTPVARVLVINNASTDGTLDMLKVNGFEDNSIVDIVTLKTNIGGAGGFYFGIDIARKTKGYTGIWIMDDDTVPQRECLERLLEADKTLAGKYSFLASSIWGPNGECMNVPEIDSSPTDSGYPGWYTKLGDGLVSIKEATFVSLLVNRKTIESCGLPCKDFFIWGDDSEYTTRVTRFCDKAYMVGASVAIHKRKGGKALDFEHETDKRRLRFNRYMFRNQIIILRYYHGALACLRYIITKFVMFVRLVIALKIDRARILLLGVSDGLIQYPKFKNFINDQLKQI